MNADVAFVADTHDRTDVVSRLLRILNGQSVETVVHLGDVCKPATLQMFAAFDVHWIRGNGDHSHRKALTEVANSIGAESHGWGETLEFGDSVFYCRHGMEHDLSYHYAATRSSIDYVMHGHYHHQERTEVGNSEVLNPGNNGAYLYDATADAFEHVAVEVDNE